MKCLILLVIVSCALAQRAKDARYNDGRYYPELYQGKYNDGKYRPDQSGAYRPDYAGRYSGKYVPYVAGKYGVGGQGGSGGAGGAGSGFSGKGGAGGAGSSGGAGSGSTFVSSTATVSRVTAGSKLTGTGVSKTTSAVSVVSKTGSGIGSRFGGAGSKQVAISTVLPVAPSRGSVQKMKSPSFSSTTTGSGSGFDRIKEQVKQYNNDGYYYRYLTEQDAQVAETGRIEDRDTDSETLRAKGFYEYVGDDGVRYRVDYNADENGFVPRGDHLPTPPPIPEAILRALEYVRSLQ